MNNIEFFLIAYDLMRCLTIVPPINKEMWEVTDLISDYQSTW